MRITENQYACHDLIKRPKFKFPQSKRFPPKHNLRGRKNNSLEQAAFWHAIKVVCGLPIPLFYTGEITMTVGRSAELEELFAWTNIWWIRLLPNPVGRTQKTFFFPWASNSKVSLCSDFKTNLNSSASKSWRSTSIILRRNLQESIHHVTEYRETLLDSLLTACMAI